MIYTVRRFSKTDSREDASPEILQKAKTSGVVQKIDGHWRIVSIKKGKLWPSHFHTKEAAQNQLKAYQSSKH